MNSLAMVAEMVVPGANSDADILCALPITKVTAMVSPSARPSPSKIAPITPIRAQGSITLRTTSQVVRRRHKRLPAAMAGSPRKRRATPTR